MQFFACITQTMTARPRSLNSLLIQRVAISFSAVASNLVLFRESVPRAVCLGPRWRRARVNSRHNDRKTYPRIKNNGNPGAVDNIDDFAVWILGESFRFRNLRLIHVSPCSLLQRRNFEHLFNVRCREQNYRRHPTHCTKNELQSILILSRIYLT